MIKKVNKVSWGKSKTALQGCALIICLCRRQNQQFDHLLPKPFQLLRHQIIVGILARLGNGNTIRDMATSEVI